MNANNKNYSIRPLTEEEKVFSADERNHNYLFFYMKKWRLDPEEWYDILIIPYLDAVKKYHEYESARQYAFSTVLKNKLWSAVTAELKKRRAKKRMPEGGFVSLDYTMEGDNPFSEYTIDEWWIDKKADVEKQVLLKMMFKDFYEECLRSVGDANIYKDELDMLLAGYSFKKILKETLKKYGGCDDDGLYTWGLEEDIKKFRKCFKKVFGI